MSPPRRDKPNTTETIRDRAWRRATRRRPLVLEPLEDRQLLSSIQEYPALNNNTNGGPTQLVISNGAIWFTEPTANTIGVFSTTTNSVTDQDGTGATNGNPPAIASTTGPNASIYFTLSSAGQLGVSKPSDPSGAPTTWDFLSHGAVLPSTAGIAVDGANLWLTAPAGNELLEIAEGSSSPSLTTTVPVSPSNLGFQNFDSTIITGPGGILYFTEATTNAGGAVTASAIGSYNPTTGTFGQILLPTSGGVQKPSGLALGPDGNIWFTESVPNAGGTGFVSSSVGVIDLANSNAISEFPTPAASEPSGITAGPDGNVWFTEKAAGAIGFVNVSGLSNPSAYTLGASIPIPTTGQSGGILNNPAPVGIIAGAAGQVWFADASGAIGLVTLTHLAVTTAPPANVTAGAGFDLTVKAESSSGAVDTQFNGNVTVSLADQPAGGGSLGGSSLTVRAVNGVATFSGLTLDTAAAGYTLQVTSSASGGPTIGVTSGINVVPAAASKLVVTAQPPGSVAIGQGFSLTVEAEDQFDNIITSYSGSATVTLTTIAGGGAGTVLSGSPTVFFSPGGSTPGFATFGGLSINNAGTYRLGVSSSSLTAATTNAFDVGGALPPPPPPPPPSPPPPPTIIGESVVLTQKFNAKHKKVGKPVLTGYTITFSTAMDQSALANGANYEIDVLKSIKTVITKVGKKKIKTKVPVYKAIGFSVTSVTSNTVQLTMAGKQTFPKGGRIQVFGGGVDNTSGVAIAQTNLLPISPSGKRIT
jgi:streptogramin lyase